MIERALFETPTEDENIVDVSDTELIFLLQSKDEFTLQFPFIHAEFWDLQTHRISRSPKKLIFHVQRIYYCFREDLSDQLYASLLDLLIVLNGNRQGLCRRLFHATKSKLSSEHKTSLEQFFSDRSMHVNDLSINSYSVLSRGSISHHVLVEEAPSEAKDENYDPLLLARDYIEYSQLAEARQVLETAIAEDINNEALHGELIELYTSTQDKQNFTRMYEYLKEEESLMLKRWEQVLPLFSGN